MKVVVTVDTQDVMLAFSFLTSGNASVDTKRDQNAIIYRAAADLEERVRGTHWRIEAEPALGLIEILAVDKEDRAQHMRAIEALQYVAAKYRRDN